MLWLGEDIKTVCWGVAGMADGGAYVVTVTRTQLHRVRGAQGKRWYNEDRTARRCGRGRKRRGRDSGWPCWGDTPPTPCAARAARGTGSRSPARTPCTPAAGTPGSLLRTDASALNLCTCHNWRGCMHTLGRVLLMITGRRVCRTMLQLAAPHWIHAYFAITYSQHITDGTFA